MSENTADLLIQKALDFADGFPVAFTFQGGEPTLAGLPFFQHFTESVRRQNKKNSPVFYGLQTNGINMDDKWARFLSQNQFLTGLSLDGDEMGNKFRKTPAGENTFRQILRAAEILKRNHAEFNILTVLTGYCAENGERIYRYFRDSGFRYLQFIPCLRPFGSDEQSELYMTSSQYADFLIKVFRLYVHDYMRGQYVSVRQFDNWVHMFLGQNVEQCGMSGRCAPQFVAESNGNIYPCDFYCTDEYLLGNILETDFQTMSASKKAVDFIEESLPVPNRCRACDFYPLCRAGGCKRTRQSGEYCDAYKQFFSACLPLFRIFLPPQTAEPQ